MAPLKYEEQLKEKLEKRRMQPMENAWEKLSDRLDNEQKKNTNKSYWWLGLAASLVGIVFIVSQFLNLNVRNKTETEVVTTPEVEIIEQQETNVMASERETIKPVEDVEVLNKEETIQYSEIKSPLKINTSSETKVAVSEDARNVEEAILVNEKAEFPNPKLTFEEQKIQDAVAQVQALENEDRKLTKTNIDALLEQAQKEIKLNRLANETTGMVDANRLLQDVEAELDQSFRSKVFEAIKSSYSSVKTAVAQRNN
ncbi:hypothetical protein [Litoribaculum gwangyangense]|uniref:Anti-sigma factor n=1 Tax=Litoribaculum gwangyangense TaxID=1130722 RepID=A0ABP9CMZ3_9FLAO